MFVGCGSAIRPFLCFALLQDCRSLRRGCDSSASSALVLLMMPAVAAGGALHIYSGLWLRLAKTRAIVSQQELTQVVERVVAFADEFADLLQDYIQRDSV